MSLEVSRSPILVAAERAAGIHFAVGSHQMGFVGRLRLEQKAAKLAGPVLDRSGLAIHFAVALLLLLPVKDFAAAGALQVLEPAPFVGRLQVVLQVVDSDDATSAKFAVERFLMRVFVSYSDMPGQSELTFANRSANFALQVWVIGILVILQSILVRETNEADLAFVVRMVPTLLHVAPVVLLLVVVQGFFTLKRALAESADFLVCRSRGGNMVLESMHLQESLLIESLSADGAAKAELQLAMRFQRCVALEGPVAARVQLAVEFLAVGAFPVAIQIVFIQVSLAAILATVFADG